MADQPRRTPTPPKGSRAERAAGAAGQRRAATGDRAGQAAAASSQIVVSEAKVARELLKPMLPQIETALPPQIPLEAFQRVILNGLQDGKRGQDLMACDRPTLYRAMLDAARYGLMPFTDEGTIVAFNAGGGRKTATFIPQYQGLIKMFYNTGQVASVTAKLIYRADAWAEGYGDGPGFYHKPRRFDEDGEPIVRGRLDLDANVEPGPGADNPPILAYCFIRFKDGARTEVEIVSKQDAVEVRDRYSRSWQNAEKSWDGKPPKRDSAWHTDFPAQWLKTAVRRAAKYAPKSPALLELLLADNQADGLLPGRPAVGAGPAALPAGEPFTPGGPAAAWPGDVEHGRGAVAQGTVVHDPPALGGTAGGGEPSGGGEPRSAADAWAQAGGTA